MDKNNIGHWGEERAAEYLRRHGYKILEMNYACRVGEIDIIARKRGILRPTKEVVFVEVKLRKSDRYGEAKDFVTAAKQRKLVLTAGLWLEETGCTLQPRFDVIEIYAPNGREGEIDLRHIENAFV